MKTLDDVIAHTHTGLLPQCTTAQSCCGLSHARTKLARGWASWVWGHLEPLDSKTNRVGGTTR